MIKSPDVYCTRTDTLGEPARARCIFFSIEAMDRLKALNENPLNRTFFTSTCITAGVTGVVTLSQKHDFTPPTLFPEIVSETKICKKKNSTSEKGFPLT